jgi:hypothetical protein
MVTSVTEGGTQKWPNKFKIVGPYWRDHSLESSWGALFDGTIKFFDSTIFRRNAFFELFSKNLSP